jgi:two-component system sensor histidine kinase CpxA
MHTLFFKIFAWFCAAVALIALSVFLVAWLTFRQPIPGPMRNPFTAFGIEAARVYEKEGQPGLAAYLSFLDEHFVNSTYLLDAQGNELAGRAFPPVLKPLLSNAGRRPPLGPPPPPLLFPPPPHEPRLSVARIQGPSGRTYIFATQNPDPPPGLFSLTPLRLSLQIIAILLSAGLGCYLLARHLTAPIVELRAATRKLADGYLSTRVASSIGKRRDELAELGGDFDRMAERMQSLMNGQKRLLGDISHELRSPLTRLNLALGVARRVAGQQADRAHDRIEREAERLNELIGQLLTLTELESGEQQIKREPVRLDELVLNIGADAEFEARGLNRSVQVETSTNCTIPGDEWLLRRAIENVVRNAIRHTDEGTTVEVRMYREPGKSLPVTVSVRDHGPGVPAHSLSKLFLPFYRVDNARDRRAGGTGLGLSITERAIRLHGGTVEASNAPGGGLAVEIRLDG